jgi:E3 ubiquitin-protein ligase HERC2
VSWDKANSDITSGRKFKWLRERRDGSSLRTTLLTQIKNFVLTDEGNLGVLHNTLQRQVLGEGLMPYKIARSAILGS